MNIKEVDEKNFTENTLPLWKKQTYPEGYTPQKEEFSYLVYDEDGTLIGGIGGVFRWDWCYVSKLVIDPKYQGQGYGTKLLKYVEELAREKQMIGIFLSTFIFQAPKFYEALGYQQFGKLQDIPKGHSMLYYAKRID